RRLSKEEQALISLVNLLERLYTNPCYTTEFNRMTTGLTTGQYPQRAHSGSVPPFCSWPAGGQPMLLVGLVCDGAIGGHIAVRSSIQLLKFSHGSFHASKPIPRCLPDAQVDTRGGGPQYFEQQTSLRELPMAQRMPLELYDMWSGYQTPAMAAMLEMSPRARKGWASMPCGDVEDLDATPVLGLSNFHKGSNLAQDVHGDDVADMREQADEGDTVQVPSFAVLLACPANLSPLEGRISVEGTQIKCSEQLHSTTSTLAASGTV
ncbi:Wwox, partial [Symbiodinium necroappetens]